MSAPSRSRARHHRSRARAWAVQVLYQWESAGTEETPRKALDTLLASRIVNPARIPHLRRIVECFSERREEVDTTVAEALDHWTFDRLGGVDRQVLRIGTTELLFLLDVPHNVVIHEAVRLAERYGSDESARFVNGILDAVAKESAPPRGVSREEADG